MMIKGHRVATWLIGLITFALLAWGILVLLAEGRYYTLVYWVILSGLATLSKRMMVADHAWNKLEADGLYHRAMEDQKFQQQLADAKRKRPELFQ